MNERVRAAIESAVAAEADGRLLVMRWSSRGEPTFTPDSQRRTKRCSPKRRLLPLPVEKEIAWIEKVEVETRPVSTTSPAASIPAFSQILAKAANDQDLLSRLEADLGELSRRAPHELRDGADDPFLTAALDGDYSSLAAGLSPILTAHLDA